MKPERKHVDEAIARYHRLGVYLASMFAGEPFLEFPGEKWADHYNNAVRECESLEAYLRHKRDTLRVEAEDIRRYLVQEAHSMVLSRAEAKQFLEGRKCSDLDSSDR